MESGDSPLVSSFLHSSIFTLNSIHKALLHGECVLRLRQTHPDVTVEAAVPCPSQADAWPPDQRRRYERLVAACDFETLVSACYTPACMQRRDRYMVDHAALLIAAFDGSPGGTRYTVEYAMRRGLEIVDLPIVLEPAR